MEQTAGTIIATSVALSMVSLVVWGIYALGYESGKAKGHSERWREMSDMALAHGACVVEIEDDVPVYKWVDHTEEDPE